MLEVVLLVLPLGLDTFAVAVALGVSGLPTARRLRVTLLFAAFEGGMPLLGVFVGRGLGSAIGGAANVIAIAGLALVGLYLLREGSDDEGEKAALLSRAQGLPLLVLGLSISVDELAIGLTVGLLRLALVWTVVLVAAQAFLAAQLGLRLGRRLGSRVGETAERLAGLALVILSAGLLGELLAR